MPALRTETLRYPMGIATVDTVLAGGIARARIHEVYATDADDFSGAAGFVALLAARIVGSGKPLVWLRERRTVQANGIVQANGLIELAGIMLPPCLFVLANDGKALLRASLDAVRCEAIGVVIVESQGRMPELDLTANRRLSLAAERSGVTLLLLRIGAEPGPSVAETRWSATSAPSHRLEANAPGMPTFDITLLRQRSGPSGMGWRLEWDRDQCIFRDATISGAVVSVPAGRPAADRGSGTLRRVA